MQEGDSLVVRPHFGARNDSVAAALKSRNFALQIVHQKRHVVKSWPTLRQMAGNGTIWRGGLQQFNLRISSLKKRCQHAFVRHFLAFVRRHAEHVGEDFFSFLQI